ncbi:hypothetical protein B0H12DRAFT_597140 [Mycena haematopus]|nr:hypothetical protein B0H12DRAFT_597140 [Mycena haematopus]
MPRRPRCPHHALASLASDARRQDTFSRPDGDSTSLYSTTLKDCGVTGKARRRGTPLRAAHHGTQLGSTRYRIQQDAGRGGGRASTRGASSEFLQEWSRVGDGVCRVESISVIIVGHHRVRARRFGAPRPILSDRTKSSSLISLARYPDGDPIPGYSSQFPPLRHYPRETSPLISVARYLDGDPIRYGKDRAQGTAALHPLLGSY